MPLENSKMLVKVKLHVTRMSRKKSVILVMVDGPLRNDYKKSAFTSAACSFCTN